MSAKHYQTKTAMAAACGISRTCMYRWLGDPAFPRKTAHGWPRRAVLAFAKKAKVKAAKRQTGENADLKRLKIQRQVDLIDRQIRRADFEHERERGKVIPLDEYHAELDQLANIVKAGLEQWVQWVAAELQNADAYVKAKEIRDRVRTRLSELCEQSGETT